FSFTMNTTCLIGHRVENRFASTTGGRRKPGVRVEPGALHVVTPAIATAAATPTLTPVRRNGREGGAGASPNLTYLRGGRTTLRLMNLPLASTNDGIGRWRRPHEKRTPSEG